MKIIKSLKNLVILILLEQVSKTFENDAKNQKGGFIGMLLGTLGVTYQKIC